MPSRFRVALTVSLIGGVALAAAQSPQSYKARLSTVPIDIAMQSTVAGRGQVTATLTGTTLLLKGTFSDLKSPATFAKIHAGPKGIRGPAILDLTVTRAVNGTIEGRLELTPEQVGHLKRSGLYVQIHSEKAPDGNLWGWLLPAEKEKP